MQLENNNEHSSIWHSFTEILYCTLLYFWYNLFVIFSQNKMVCHSFSITGIGHHELHWCFHKKLASLFSKSEFFYMRVLTVLVDIRTVW